MAEQPVQPTFEEWLHTVDQYELLSWDRLPELDLYMDQVITLMNKILCTFTTVTEKTLTPSMINNYVKDGVLPRPEHKKYSRDHLVRLMMICMLKSILTLPEVDTILQGLLDGETTQEMYPYFAKVQQETLRGTVERVNRCNRESPKELYRLAMELAVEANARRITASRILDSLKPAEIVEEKKSKKEK